jgi:hypothetical protein
MLVAELLHQQKYSLQANRKTTEGASHPDRNAQFEHINAKAEEFLKLGQPAISVDTKKKEQVGEYKNRGVGSGGRRGDRNWFKYTISQSRKMSLMGCTIWDRTRDGLASAPITTPPLSPSRASGGGGA